MINYRSYNDLFNVISENIAIIPDEVDLIVGIPRSGMVPAHIIANLKDCGVIDFYSFLKNEIVRGGLRFGAKEKNAFDFKKVLIFDDSIISGASLNTTKQLLKEAFLPDDIKISFGVVYATNDSKKKIDHFFELIEYPRVFQWNMFNHAIIENSCFDLDGVLCYDVPEEVNDDGEKYIDYIKNVKVLIKPGKRIKKIVTCRLEKYREITEEWLKKNEISYEELVMLDLRNGEERRRWGRYGEFKEKEFKQSNCMLFVESSYSQAVIISKGTGKAVYCVDTKQMINTNIYDKNSGVLFQLPKLAFLKRGFRKVKKYLTCNFKYKAICRKNNPTDTILPKSKDV